MNLEKDILKQFRESIFYYYGIDQEESTVTPKRWYPMFHDAVKYENYTEFSWVKKHNEMFLDNTPNKFLFTRVFLSELGCITSMVYSPNGHHVICGHSSGLIQMRNGKTGIVLATLRNIQFPHRPVYSLVYSRAEERVCYAACTDGSVYRIEIPNLDANTSEKKMCIRANPDLGCLHTQFYGSPGISSYSTPFIVSTYSRVVGLCFYLHSTERAEAWSLGLTCDSTKMLIGYNDCTIKLFDVTTQQVDTIFRVNRMRLNTTPKKLQRYHTSPVCSVQCHNEKPTVFATAAWDKTLRVWDTRCQVGCMMTFEGVDCVHDSIDFNREQLINGSWQTTEALSVWDLTAHKRQCVVRVQNRRPDVDGEYIYACRYWRSSEFNRKGKYAIIGGSGTKCVEVINLHNRYISCSYPAPGTVLAVASHEERIAFGGTAPVFNMVSFHDPKHEKLPHDSHREDNDYAKAAAIMYEKTEACCKS